MTERRSPGTGARVPSGAPRGTAPGAGRPPNRFGRVLTASATERRFTFMRSAFAMIMVIALVKLFWVQTLGGTELAARAESALEVLLRATEAGGLRRGALEAVPEHVEHVGALGVGLGVGCGVERGKQRGDRRFVRSLPRRECDDHRKAAMVDDGIDLRAQSATRTTDGVILAPCLPEAAC